MALAAELRTSTSRLIATPWQSRETTTVPRTADLALADGAATMTAAYLYADLADSTELQMKYGPELAARVVRMYLNGAAKLIRTNGGSIKSYDGDRVMGVFVGGSKKNDAVWAAMQLCWLVDEIINPLVKDATFNGVNYWIVTHGVGIDCGEVFIARAGVRNTIGDTAHNDLISIGQAPNVAAKLSALRDRPPITVTADVHVGLNEHRRYASDGSDMWIGPTTTTVGPYSLGLYSTTYRWVP